MAGPNPATNEWVPIWNPVATGPVGPPGPSGPAGAAVAAAKYWVVEPFAGLTNARALNAFTTGYVRSTAGEPSVVPTIPLTDTTGILPDNRLTSNVALKNINNFFAPQTLGSGSEIVGGNSLLGFTASTSPVNQRVWRIVCYGDGSYRIESLTDTGTIQASYNFLTNGQFASHTIYATGQFIGNGAQITALNGSNIASGLIHTARMGNGAPTTATFLRGDNTWATIPFPPQVDPFPLGLIVISAGPCPPGWTRVNWDGRFLKSGPTYGVMGGVSYHNHTHDIAIPAHGHGPGVTTLSGDHTHPFNGSIAGRTGDSLGGSSGADAGGSFTAPYYAHSHDFGASFGGNTVGGGNHSHEVTVQNAAAIGATGGIGFTDHMPPFIDVLFCQKTS